MIIKIKDEFDPGKIAFSGQCFRAKKNGDAYRFITKENYVDISHLRDGLWDVSCTKEEWDNIWYHYFDLEKDYSEIRKRYRGINSFTDKSLEASKGLRILNQDKFETLISFIISQRKNIPAISKCIETLCQKYGKKHEDMYYFPSPESLANKSGLDCMLGYRDEYVIDAAEKIANKDIDLDELGKKNDCELLESLMKIKGVGIKVASCVALFAYSRGKIAPRDVWINRIIDSKFDGKSPFEDFSCDAGIMQQYMFYYQRTLNNSASSALSGD